MIELHGFSLDDMVDLASYCRKSDACNLIASAFVKIFKVRPDKTVEITPINKYEKCFKAFPGLSKYGVKLNVQGVERALRSLLQFSVNRALSGRARLADRLNSSNLLLPPKINGAVMRNKKIPPRKRAATATNFSYNYERQIRNTNTGNNNNNNLDCTSNEDNSDFLIQYRNLENEQKIVTFCPIVNSPKKLINAMNFARGLFELEYTCKRYHPAVLAVLRYFCIGTSYFNTGTLIGAGHLNEYLLAKIIKSFQKIQKDNIAVLFSQCIPPKLRDHSYTLASKIDTSLYSTNYWKYLWDAELIEVLAQNAGDRADVCTFKYLESMMAEIPSGNHNEIESQTESNNNRPQTDHINTDKFLDMCKCLYYAFV